MPHSGLIQRMRPQDQGPALSWRTASWEALSQNDIPKEPAASTLALLAQVRELRAGHWPDADVLPTALPAECLAGQMALVLTCHDQPAHITAQLIALAQSEHPSANVVLVPSGPDEAAERTAMGHAPATQIAAGVWRLPGVINLFDWATHACGAYTWQADTGFEALLAGIPVTTLGNPFYAGWGHTRDVAHDMRPKGIATLPALFESTAICRSAYADVNRMGQGELSDVLACVRLQREVRARYRDLGRLVAHQMSGWKRPFLRPYLEAGGHPMRWCGKAQTVQLGAQESVALWGAHPWKGQETSKPPVRVEDGFLRSAGLGSDLMPPRSLVLDRRGIYFDARGGSELIDALNHEEVDAKTRERAVALRALLVTTGITKYNFVRRRPEWVAPVGQRVVLVAGQVADDASIALGSGSQAHHPRTAERLLQAVRERCPNDYVVYKPHPDVLSGNRQGLIHAQSWCDLVDSRSDLLSLVEVSDEVHVISSLAGLDALIRGKKVVTHGMPFYAGWGLTTDLCKELPRRLRGRDISELLALCLIRYPLYWDWEWGVFSTAEATIRQLCLDREQAVLPGEGQRASRALHKTKKWLQNMLSE